MDTRLPSHRRQLQTRIAQLFASQHGVVSREQVLKLGMSKSSISRRLVSGEWVAVHSEVYRVASSPQTSRQSLAAAGLWAGPNGAVSHRAALNLWGCPCSFDMVEVVTSHRRSPRPGVRLHSARELPSEQLTTKDGVRVTSPARTLLDIAGLFPMQTLRECDFEFGPEPLLKEALEFFYRERLVTPESLASFLSHPRVKGLRGRRMLLRVLRTRRKEGAQLPVEFEAEIRRFISTEGLHPLEENLMVGGVRIPFGYPTLKIAVIPHRESFIEYGVDLRVPLEAEGWVALEVRPTDPLNDPEWVAFRLSFMVTARGAMALRPRRRRPTRRPWVPGRDRRYLRFLIDKWRHGATAWDSFAFNWPGNIRLIHYSPTTRIDYERERRLHAAEGPPRRRRPRGEVPPEQPRLIPHPLTALVGPINY